MITIVTLSIVNPDYNIGRFWDSGCKSLDLLKYALFKDGENKDVHSWFSGTHPMVSSNLKYHYLPIAQCSKSKSINYYFILCFFLFFPYFGSKLFINF